MNLDAWTSATRAWMAVTLAVASMSASLRADVVTLPIVADTSLTSSAPGNNAGGHAWVSVGTDGPFGGNATRRGLFRFDTSSLPNGAAVTSAVVRLRVVMVPGTDPANSTFDLFRLQMEWGEGNKIGAVGAPASAGEATWNSRLHGTATWTTPGAAGDAVATASASVAVTAASGAQYSWTGEGIIDDVQFWVDNPSQNFGWLMTSQSEGASRTVRGFGASEGASPGTLEVGYTIASMPLPPTVNIVNRTNGGTFVAGLPITIEAEATDPDGSVTNVSFFDGETLLGSDSTSPYSVDVTIYSGQHVFTAVATDDDGQSTTSAAVTNNAVTEVIQNPIAQRIPKGNIAIELETVADGMAAPLGMAAPDDGSGRLFVYDQNGQVWVVSGPGRLPAPLLDVRERLVLLGAYDERGLLGFTAHPDFAANPLVYTYTSEPYTGSADFETGLGTNNNHQSVIAEWQISAGNSNVIDTASRREILRIDQPQSNHNGGAMHFGPDGMLYVVLGDGGAANDVAAGHVPGGNAQDMNRIWGKLLRIDVHGTNSSNGQYSVPEDNPFVGADGLDEIWASGLRNPFSFDFERGTTNLYLADVGQNAVEEINVITRGGNYGWNVKEGTFWFDGSGRIVTGPVRPPPPDLVDPIAQYDHDDGLAVLAGYVYHGNGVTALNGRFVFGDWGSFTAPSGRLFYLDETNGVNELRIGLEDRPLGLWLRGYGQDTEGELYLFCSRQLGPSGNTGRMLKLVAVPAQTAMTNIARSDVTNVVVGWSGGAGPVALQKKTILSDPVWANATFAAAFRAVVPALGPAAFFRAFDAAHVPPIPFSTHMTGAAERPTPNNSTATGSGIFALDGNTLYFNIRYAGLSAQASAAHIHGPANAATSTGVLIDLAPYNGGSWGTNGTLSGVVVLTDEQKAMVMDGRTYVNVHNTPFPGGEIRGQIAPVNMQLSLSGAKENPVVQTTGGGLGNLTLVGNLLTFNVTYAGLPGPATAAHIHGPASESQSTNVLVDLGPSNGGSFGTRGTLSGAVTLTPTQLAYVIDGLTYINVHTMANPGGEIRGQILPQSTGVPLTAALSGLAEHPPLTNSAIGSGTFSLEDDTLVFNMSYSGLSEPATAAHIHGYTNTTGDTGVIIDLAPFNGGSFGASGTVSGTRKLTKAQRDGILAGRTYVNFHTTANPGGELRGQIAPVSMFASLSGANEGFNGVDSPGSGFATFALVRNQLSLNLTYRDLLSSATASHIHGPASFFQSTNVIHDLAPYNTGAYGSSGALAGTATLPYPVLLRVIDGSTYINFHTTNYPGGEIRGQIMR